MCNFLASVIVRAGLLLACAAVMVPAEADNGTLYVAPGPTTLISPDMIKRSQDQLGGTVLGAVSVCTSNGGMVYQ
jgi:hypothetical protein